VLGNLRENFNCETTIQVFFKNWKTKVAGEGAELTPFFFGTMETHFSCTHLFSGEGSPHPG
jgi:hypothetical protein